MKKFLGIFIALLLVISLFATTAVAFADGEKYKVTYAAGEEGEGTGPAEASYDAGAEVTLAAASAFTAKKGFEFDYWQVSGSDTQYSAEDKFTITGDVTVTAVWKEIHKVKVTDKLNGFLEEDEFFNSLKFEMGDVKFGVKLMESVENVQAAFDGIKYAKDDKDVLKKDNDVIYVEYCRPSESPKGQENWQNSVKITESIRLSSSGWYLFRIVVKDSTGKNVLAASDGISRYAEDTSRPVVSLSTTMKNKVENGLVAEEKYSVPTSGLTNGSTDEMSTTTVNFKVYKVVNSEDVLIYDSVSKEITEGYKEFVDVDGAITPSKNDISDSTVYKIVYSVTDAYGFSGIADKENIQNYSALEFNPVMELKVVAAPAKDDNSAINVWEIVLFCIAGASAIGIVVLLCIKPKEAAPARVASVAKEEKASIAEEESNDEPQE